jgi:hypothetical protein
MWIRLSFGASVQLVFLALVCFPPVDRDQNTSETHATQARSTHALATPHEATDESTDLGLSRAMRIANRPTQPIQQLSLLCGLPPSALDQLPLPSLRLVGARRERWLSRLPCAAAQLQDMLQWCGHQRWGAECAREWRSDGVASSLLSAWASLVHGQDLAAATTASVSEAWVEHGFVGDNR